MGRRQNIPAIDASHLTVIYVHRTLLRTPAFRQDRNALCRRLGPDALNVALFILATAKERKKMRLTQLQRQAFRTLERWDKQEARAWRKEEEFWRFRRIHLSSWGR